MARKSSGNGTSFGCSMIIAFVLVNILLGGFCTEYVVEFWSSYFKDTVIDVPFWPCAIVGLFLGELTIPAAAFTWVLSFVL